MDYGFVKVAAAVPELKVAGCGFNTGKIIEMIMEASEAGVQLVAFPELSLTAYSCGDLFHQQLLLREALSQLKLLAESTNTLDIVILVGLPVLLDNQQFNCAAVLQKGEILGVVPKTYIPGYKEFYEERWFTSGNNAISDEIELFGKQVPFGTDLLFEAAGQYNVCFGVEICEDLWVPIPPSSYQALAGAAILFNLSASNEIIGKYEYRRELVRQQSGKCIAGYVYTSAGVHESTTDIVYGGHALIAENGGLLCESERFLRAGSMIISEIDVQKLQNDRIKNTSFMEGFPGHSFRKIGFRLGGSEHMDSISIKTTASAKDTTLIKDMANIKDTVQIGDTASVRLTRHIDPHPFVPPDESARDIRCSEIFAIQTAGLAKRLEHTGMEAAVVGISGGLDSTLALLVTAKTFDMLNIPRNKIIAVTMPGFGTTDTTYQNALELIRSIGAELREINIKKACMQHFSDIGHDPSIHDVTYENVQARERTQILMDIANKHSGLVIGTGDLSELALGWCTYNGDHMSMYSVNCSIPKTLVKYLVRWAADNVTEQKSADVLLRILDTPITPELLPPDENGRIQQKTEDIVGPYELHDFFLYHTLRYGAPPLKVLFLAQQAFNGSYSAGEIKSWLKAFYKRFFSQQFKRSCLPDGPKVGTISLSPRGDWRMPSDASAELWLKELE
jgi:NAD+ synthase (glutamine-hydrolysing)